MKKSASESIKGSVDMFSGTGEVGQGAVQLLRGRKLWEGTRVFPCRLLMQDQNRQQSWQDILQGFGVYYSLRVGPGAICASCSSHMISNSLKSLCCIPVFLDSCHMTWGLFAGSVSN